jgi:hypothetical protein
MDAPAVAVSSDGKKIVAAWMDTRAGGNDRDVQWTVGSGGKFAPESPASDDTRGLQSHPSLVFDAEGTAWCAWEDSRGGPNDQRLYAADWKSRKNVAVSDPSEGPCGFPSLACAGGAVAVAYEAGSGVSFRTVAAAK